MKISASGLAFIKQWEGCKLSAYLDGGGVATIGVGHVEGVKMGQTISQFEADELLAMDLEDHDITSLLGAAQTSQRQFDAMQSLAFNIGLKAFAGSTVLKRHKLGNYIGAANAILMWDKDNGKIVNGLVRRREAERKVYLGSAA